MKTGIGRTIFVTRAESADSRFEDTLESAGFKVVRIPLVTFARADEWDKTVTKLQNLGYYDWLVFTSPRAVEFTLQALDGVDFSEIKVACVSNSTARIASKSGFNVQLTGTRGGAELAELLKENSPARILLPSGNLSTGELARKLRAADWQVFSPIVYATKPNTANMKTFAKRFAAADAVVFHSGSAVQVALAALAARSSSAAEHLFYMTRVYSFGPSATDVLSTQDINLALEAAKSDQLAFAESIIDFERQLG